MPAAAGGGAFTSWVALIFIAGSADQATVRLHVPYTLQIWIWRFAVLIVPVIVYYVTRGVCRELKRNELHPLRGGAARVRRTAEGGFEVVE